MLKFNPKVSIVIPVYNGSNYLKEAIDSALAQTYKNIEVIVINDGSTDNGATEKIAKSYGEKIRYFKKKNGGVATALNLGIKKMTGEYFSWLSHDDLYYPDKIEKQIMFLSDLENKNVVLYSNYSIKKKAYISPVILHNEMLKRKPKYSLLRGCINGITVLIPKEILMDIGYFNDELRCTQDYDYWMRIQDKYDFIHINEVLSVTRLHDLQDSVMSPDALKEGNALWIRLVEWMRTEEKIIYEYTLYNFYNEMVEFLKTTPYREAEDFCKLQIETRSLEYALGKPTGMVSIIIPFYNRVEDTLVSINSAINQTYRNIEVLLINDGSEQNIEKIKSISEKHKNIRLINLDKNSGAARARNVGIKYSKGEYIAFLDSDDEFKNNKIEYQLTEMMKRNTEISYTAYERVMNGQDATIVRSDLSGVLVPTLIKTCPIATPTVIIKKSILSEHKIKFNESMRIGEDTCFWLELAKITEILYIDSPLSVVNASSDSSAYSPEKLQVGMNNILRYLITDSYYSKFNHEVLSFARDCCNVDSLILQKEDQRLEHFGKLTRSMSTSRNTVYVGSLPYRLVRKVRRDGVISTYRLAVDKLRSKIIN